MENSTIRKRVTIVDPKASHTQDYRRNERDDSYQRDSTNYVSFPALSKSQYPITQRTPRFTGQSQIQLAEYESKGVNVSRDSLQDTSEQQIDTLMTLPIETEDDDRRTTSRKTVGFAKGQKGVPDILNPYTTEITFIIPPSLTAATRESVAPEKVPFSMPKPSIMPNRTSLYPGRKSQAKKLAQSHRLAMYESLIKSDPDYFNFPADLQLAENRARLKRPHYPNQPFEESKIPLFVPNRSLQRHSLTYFLFFRFMAESVAILFIIFFMSCIYDLVILAVYASNRSPTLENVDLTNLKKALDSLTMIQKNPPAWANTVKISLNLVSVILIRIFVIAKDIDRKGTYSDSTQTYTENDFSVMVKYIPREVTKQQITAYFNKKCTKVGFGKVQHVIMLLDLTKALKLKEQKKKLLRAYILDTTGSKRIGILEQMKQLDSQILRIRLNQEKNESAYQSAIVVFDHPLLKQEMIKIWKRSGRAHRRILRFLRWIFCCCRKKKGSAIRGASMRVRPCGEPADLNYENIPISNTARNIRKYTAILIVGFLILLFPAFQIAYQFGYRVTIADGGILSADTNTSPLYFTLLCMGLFLIIKVTLQIVARRQKMVRKSDTEKFKLSALVVLSFFNYNLLLVTKLFTYVDDQLPYVYDLTSLLIGMVITSQVLAFFDFGYLFKLYKRRKYRNNKQLLERLSQAEADMLMENSEYDFSGRVNNYAQILFTCLSTYVFFPIAPLVGIMAICSSYYIDRYTILRRAPRIKVKGFDLGLLCFRIFEFDILAQSFGNVFYAVYLYMKNGGNLDTPTIVMGGIFAFLTLSYIFNLNGILRKRFGSKRINKKRKMTLQGIKTYEQVKGTFKQTYYDDYKTFLTKNDLLSML